jgi:hypothetical protein
MYGHAWTSRCSMRRYCMRKMIVVNKIKTILAKNLMKKTVGRDNWKPIMTGER